MIFSLTILKVTNVNFSGRSMINLRLIVNSMIEIYGKLEPKIFHGLPKFPVFHVLFLKKFSHLLINEFFEMVYLVMNRLVRLLDLLISLNFSTRKTFFHKSQKCFLGARKLNMWNTNFHSQRHQADHVRFFFVRLSWIFK